MYIYIFICMYIYIYIFIYKLIYKGDLNGLDIGIGMYGLQGMSATVPEVSDILYYNYCIVFVIFRVYGISFF
jgi:uncharacterized membrane protein YtjA (UPF0391 family)